MLLHIDYTSRLIRVVYSPLSLTSAVLKITASHQTFSSQFWCLSGQNKFDLTHLLYIINGKVSVFLEDKVMSEQISTLIISTASATKQSLGSTRHIKINTFCTCQEYV